MFSIKFCTCCDKYASQLLDSRLSLVVFFLPLPLSFLKLLLLVTFASSASMLAPVFLPHSAHIYNCLNTHSFLTNSLAFLALFFHPPPRIVPSPSLLTMPRIQPKYMCQSFQLPNNIHLACSSYSFHQQQRHCGLLQTN